MPRRSFLRLASEVVTLLPGIGVVAGAALGAITTLQESVRGYKVVGTDEVVFHLVDAQGRVVETRRGRIHATAARRDLVQALEASGLLAGLDESAAKSWRARLAHYFASQASAGASRRSGSLAGYSRIRPEPGGVQPSAGTNAAKPEGIRLLAGPLERAVPALDPFVVEERWILAGGGQTFMEYTGEQC
jgi:hypothetical protein